MVFGGVGILWEQLGMTITSEGRCAGASGILPSDAGLFAKNACVRGYDYALEHERGIVDRHVKLYYACTRMSSTGKKWVFFSDDRV